MNKNSQILTVREKIGYSLGDLAANLVFQTLMTYLAYFYTDIYGLSSEDSSYIILTVGLISAFSFNPIVGAIADRTNSRWGKFRPWILWTSLPLGIISILAFSTPEFSYKGKLIYATVTYTLLLLLYAANNLPYSALSGVITGDMKERNSMSSYRFVAVMFAQFFVQVFMYPIILKVGDGDKALGIETVMTYLAIIGTFLLIVTFLTTKERVIPKPEQRSSLKEDILDLSSNTPWIIMLSVTTLLFITLSMKGGAYIYYFENYVSENSLKDFINPLITLLSSLGLNFFGDDPISAGFGLFNAGGITFMIIGISFSKYLADRFGKRDVFMSSLFISTIFIAIFFFFENYNVELMFLSQIFHGFFYGITIPLLWAMIADVADYSEWKNNRRATAIIFSAMMVGLKGGLSIGGAMVTSILGAYNYRAGLIQLDSTLEGIKLLISIFPSIPFLVCILILFAYEIDKKKELIIENDLKNRR
tara:strand:+ start:1246 stop:2673 length:1428 start_codon:yes stop_codon:yes gene_type:complete